MIAFLSDIHGNAEALGTCHGEVDALKPDRLICLGDVIGYGPNPRECLREVIGRCEFSMLGNHEHAAMFYASDFNPRARQAIDWTRDQLNRRDCSREENMQFWNYLDGMKKEHREASMLFVHASPRDPVREYMIPQDATDQQKMDGCFAAMGDAQLCFIGHSHVPGIFTRSGEFLTPSDVGMEWQVDQPAIVNVGSVGQPRDGDPRASFATYDGDGTGGTVRFFRKDYDFETTMGKIRGIEDLPDYLADRLPKGK